MIALSLVAAILTLLAAGYGMVSLLAPKEASLTECERLALAWLLGSVTVSFSLWILGQMLRGVYLQSTEVGICLLLGLIAWRRGQRFSFYRPSLLQILLVLEIALVFYGSFRNPLGWDGLFNWEIKARYAYLNGGSVPSAIFADHGRVFSHAEYPLAIPFTELWFYLWVGEPNQFLLKLIFPAFFAAEVFFLAATLSRAIGATLGHGLAALLFFIPQFTIQPGSAIVGYADLPLSFCYLAAITFLLRSLRSPDFLPLFVGCGMWLPWFKREGAILLLVALACAMPLLWAPKRRAFYYILPMVVPLLSWKLFLFLRQPLATGEFARLSFSTLIARSDRIGPILGAFRDEICRVGDWSCFWLIILVAIIYLFPRWRELRVTLLLLALVVPIICYLSTYLFSNWTSLQGHLAMSLSRLLMQVAPLGFVAIALALQPQGRLQTTPE